MRLFNGIDKCVYIFLAVRFGDGFVFRVRLNSLFLFLVNGSAKIRDKNTVFFAILIGGKGVIVGPFTRLRRRNIDNRSVRSSIFVSKIAVRIHLVVNAVGIACLLDNTLCLRYRNRVYDQQERAGFSAKLTEETEGDVAGIKGCTIYVQGEWAYGTLRTETGIHRLVRKSPFDANARRHTSFASVYIYPEIDDSIEITINPADLRVDVFRASGAGGQHVQKTESAVRITHIPTGVVTVCQDDRSQHNNREQAMRQLKAKLYELELRKRMAEQEKLEESKSDIGWGHQIRSYVLDQSRVKDLRTNVETGNTGAVLDGDLDQFIEASLKMGI